MLCVNVRKLGERPASQEASQPRAKPTKVGRCRAQTRTILPGNRRIKVCARLQTASAGSESYSGKWICWL